ncbi:LLM class flavin-dependent oxidoreductase [Streptomyces sp. AK02-01A]|uniref:LLM class flavin-dependent oxidoreductase n=1 Tax=Streptomyces sp. AK02-01A TaxID=3028648 RepID=UPI0029B25395|nr:LLM class flavin-dependent oxidoreductase [Streptomyces sp. AK02-01A]MDX3853456.1 LLM class flavin-dependent oxidoreductase [Streptomyces sp. AK02-01A]
MGIPTGSVGLNIDPSSTGLETARRLAQLADESGLDFVGVQDHLYHPEFLDAWTLITSLAATTQRVTFMTNVANTVLRPPAPLIKAASTLSTLSGGRVVLGVGAGAAPPATAAYGGPQYSPAQATDAFEEAMRVMKAMSDPAQRAVRFDGKYHRVSGAHPGPLPARPVPIMVGSYGPRMLRITGRLGDGWLPTNSYAPPERVPELQRVIDEAATAAGRDPRSVQRIYNVMGTVTDDGNPVFEGQNLVGPPGFWVDTLHRYREELGFDSFLFWPVNADSEAQAALFAEKVAPHVRLPRQPSARGAQL